MASNSELRGSHPCLERRCGHPETDHLPTPELAGPAETVVWCVSCRRHEIHRPRRWPIFGLGGARPRKTARFTGPN